MGRHLVRSSESLRDVVELADYIARDSLDAAFRFLDAVDSTFQFLTRNSGTGQLCHFEDPETEGIRVWLSMAFDIISSSIAKRTQNSSSSECCMELAKLEALFGSD